MNKLDLFKQVDGFDGDCDGEHTRKTVSVHLPEFGTAYK